MITMEQQKAADSRPIFIIGINRSGTTLLGLMLDSHSRIAIPHESHFFLDYYRRRADLGDRRDTAPRLELVRAILAEPYIREWDYQPRPEEIDLDRCTSLEETIRQVYLTYARAFGKDIWGDKTPRYATEAHILNRMFPDARYVHIIRDGRDVALSVIRQYWGTNDFMTALRTWAEWVTCCRKMLAMLPEDRSVELRFEDLVTEPEQELRRVTRFLGVDFEPGMVAAYTEKAAAKVGHRIRAHHATLTQPPRASEAFKWKRSLSAADQAVAHEIAGSVLAELGYPSGVTHHPLRLARKGYYRVRESVAWRLGWKAQNPRPNIT